MMLRFDLGNLRGSLVAEKSEVQVRAYSSSTTATPANSTGLVSLVLYFLFREDLSSSLSLLSDDELDSESKSNSESFEAHL